jgi:ketosteroid isomerase-like protein
MIMQETRTHSEEQELVRDYFSRLRAIHSGDRGAVDRMLELWDDDGTCTFVGSPPLNGQFRGTMALATLFNNMVQTMGTKVQTEDGEDVAVGQPSFTVERMKSRGNKVVAEWTLRVKVDDCKSFSVAGSNTYTFKGDRIAEHRAPHRRAAADRAGAVRHRSGRAAGAA